MPNTQDRYTAGEFSQVFERHEEAQDDVVKAFLVLTQDNGIPLDRVLDVITYFLIPGTEHYELIDQASKLDWSQYKPRLRAS